MSIGTPDSMEVVAGVCIAGNVNKIRIIMIGYFAS